jgi:hypothetical protein
MTAAAIATTATVEAARITRHSFPGDPLAKTTSVAAGTTRRGDVTQRPWRPVGLRTALAEALRYLSYLARGEDRHQ